MLSQAMLDNEERTALQYLLEGDSTRTDFEAYFAGVDVSSLMRRLELKIYITFSGDDKATLSITPEGEFAYCYSE